MSAGSGNVQHDQVHLVIGAVAVDARLTGIEAVVSLVSRAVDDDDLSLFRDGALHLHLEIRVVAAAAIGTSADEIWRRHVPVGVVLVRVVRIDVQLRVVAEPAGVLGHRLELHVDVGRRLWDIHVVDPVQRVQHVLGGADALGRELLLFILIIYYEEHFDLLLYADGAQRFVFK